MYIFKTYWFLKPEYWEPDLRQVTLNQSSLICKIHIAMEPLISTLLNKINCIVFFFKITFLCWLVWEYKWLNIMASIEGGAGIDKVTLCAWFFFSFSTFFRDTLGIFSLQKWHYTILSNLTKPYVGMLFSCTY